MKKYILGTLVLSIGISGLVWSTFSSVAAATTSCNAISVLYTPTELPPGAYPEFTITSPDGTTIADSRFFPGNGAIFTANNGGSLPTGTYEINVDRTVGTSRLKSINYTNNVTRYTLGCPDRSSITYTLAYTPSEGGEATFRINPAPQTVQVGRQVFFGAEYSADGGEHWTDVSDSTGFSSPQDIRVNPNGFVDIAGRPHGGSLTEVVGKAVGTAEIIAMYGGLTRTVSLGVTSGSTTPPPTGGTCPGIIAVSNVPTTWTITGPNGVSVRDPNGTGPSTGFTVTKSSTGGTLPAGEYTIQVSPSLPNGQNPTLSGYGPMNGGIAPYGCVRGTWMHVTVTYGGGTATNGVLQFQKKLLDMGTVVSGAVQGIHQGAYINNHFVLRGAGCSVNMNDQVSSFQSGGGGLWSISDDGSSIQERQMCLDAGAASNIIYHHGANEGRMYANEGSDFLFTNSTWGACVSGMHDGWCDVNGPGATRSVYYGFSGNQVVRRSIYPISDDPEFLGSSIVVSGEYALDGVNVTRLLDWERVGSSGVTGSISFAGYVIGRPSGSGLSTPYKVYKVENGDVTEVGALPGGIRSYVTGYTFDFSKSPVQLVLFDSGEKRLVWFKADNSGLQVVKEADLSSDFTGTPGGLNSFAVWGDYVLWPFAGEAFSGGVVVGKINGTTIRKTESVVLPDAGRPSTIIASPSGNVVITTANALDSQSYDLRTQAYLYKIGTPNPPVIPPGGGVLPTDLTFSALLAENILRVMGDGSCPTQPTNTQAFETAYFRAVRGDSPVYVQDQFFSCVFNKAIQSVYSVRNPYNMSPE